MLYEIIIALAVITGAPDAEIPEIAGEASVRFWAQHLAVQMEILDEREVRYVLARPEDCQADYQLLRRRYKELADVPSVHDAMRFLPDRSAINDLLSFNRAYREHLVKAQLLYPSHPRWWQYQSAIQETDRLYAIWDTLRDAKCEYYYVTVRRQALKRLRDDLAALVKDMPWLEESLSKHPYYQGALPPHVPVWQFQRID